VTKYTADGTKAWTRLAGGAGDDIGYSVATGADGAVYIAGLTNSGALDGQTSNGGIDGFVTKYTADGTKAWTRLAGGAGNDYGQSVATGGDGSVYIAGHTDGGSIDGQASNGGVDGFVTKLSAFGPQITFAAGSSTATLAVHAIADELTEAPETLTVSVLAGDGYTLGATSVATGTIEDRQSVIDLGSYGKLIAPVQVEGAWYYFWDRNGDGISRDDDKALRDVLGGIFTQDINGGTDGGGNTTDTYRYATLNGVHVALPTANGGVAYPQGIGAFQNGTAYTDAGAASNASATSFNELLAIWDAYNGTGTGTNIDGRPTGWENNAYWSATPSAYGNASVDLGSGIVFDESDSSHRYVALQVL
jgi:hypothetical protein